MWIIPSRARPHNIARLAERLRDLNSKPPILLRLDYDDPSVGGYYGMGENWKIVTGPRKPLSDLYNECPMDWPWYGILADDVMPETQDWSRKMVEAAGTDGMAYPGDPAHFVLGGDLVRNIGWVALPGLDRIYIDTVWKDIAEARGVLRDVGPVLTHRRGLMDATYKKHHKAEDRAVYEAWRASGEPR